MNETNKEVILFENIDSESELIQVLAMITDVQLRFAKRGFVVKITKVKKS